MYHGTSIDSARLIISNGFKPSAGGLLGKGVYVSRDKKKASNYPPLTLSGQRVILVLRARLGRVKRIDKDNHPMQQSWHAHGYDTAWVPPKCGLAAVPSGLEEDCVFDPKRLEVVGITNAPSPAIQKELLELLSKTSKKAKGGVGSAAEKCSLCKRKTQRGTPHITQRCWECGQNICILMTKHFCQGRP